MISNILILGSGGREHALAWKIAQSRLCKELFIAPGNAGTQYIGTNVSLNILDFESIASFVEKENIDYIIVGPEAPLVEGIYDFFEDKEVKVFGPSKKAAQLEGSKAFANAFMADYNIPTASSINITADNIQEGYKYIDQQLNKIVLKADGLAGGKGVLILDNKEEAKQCLKQMLNGQFGEASQTVVIEEFLDGIEFSVFVLTNGKEYKILPIAKDYKRIGEADTGLNTGGMGAISPVPFVDDILYKKVEENIVKPTLKGLSNRGLTYYGFIFIGLIKVDNEPYVIEYNCRLGDPETEVVIPRIETDLLSLIKASINHKLDQHSIDICDAHAATIMLVSGGYPQAYEKNKKISISNSISDSLLFHAGTKIDNDNLLTNGGRVIAVTSLADHFSKAIDSSMKTINHINFDNMYYRRDIGFDLK